ncbi:MAG: hypothetical protein JXA54_11410 [Candidatus Heimdallarchaeota archaeon]|nr:hypothetical protein [Candidatus Heimdallarchaeota archaeon]
MSYEREFTISEMIGKSAFSSDEIVIGKITKIIDQSDTDQDNPEKLCDIEKDLFQVVVLLDHLVFSSLQESSEILFSSQTLEKVINNGIQLKLTKDAIDSTIKASLG